MHDGERARAPHPGWSSARSSRSFTARVPSEIRRWPGNPTAAPSRTMRPAASSAARSAVRVGDAHEEEVRLRGRDREAALRELGAQEGALLEHQRARAPRVRAVVEGGEGRRLPRRFTL